MKTWLPTWLSVLLKTRLTMYSVPRGVNDALTDLRILERSRTDSVNMGTGPVQGVEPL